MTNLADLRARAEAATDDWYFPSELMEATDNEADAAYISAADPQTILRLLDLLTEALDIIDGINGCHGCLDNGSTEDRETVERLRDALAERQAPR